MHCKNIHEKTFALLAPPDVESSVHLLPFLKFPLPLPVMNINLVANHFDITDVNATALQHLAPFRKNTIFHNLPRTGSLFLALKNGLESTLYARKSSEGLSPPGSASIPYRHCGLWKHRQHKSPEKIILLLLKRQRIGRTLNSELLLSLGDTCAGVVVVVVQMT